MRLITVVVLAVLAAVPLRGVAFSGHTLDMFKRVEGTQYVVLVQHLTPVCIHMDWRTVKPKRSPPVSRGARTA